MIGERIYYFRKLNGQTQEQLAHGICSISHLSKIENGHETPGPHILEHLCKRLNISLRIVDPQEAVNSMNKQLDSWYNHLCNRNIEESARLYSVLCKQVELIEDPNTLLKYKLFTLKYTLLNQKLCKATHLVNELKKFKGKLKTDLAFYYFYILGLYHFKKGEYLKSLKHYIKAEESGEELRIEAPELYYQLAVVNMELYRTYYSTKYANHALMLFNDNCNYVRSIECQNISAINAIRVNHFTEAEKHLYNAFHVSRLLHQEEGMSWTYCNFGYLSFKQGELKESISYYEKSLDTNLEKQGEKNIITYYRIARSYYELNDIKTAKKWIEKGLASAEELNNTEFTFHFKVFQTKLSNNSHNHLEDLLKNKVIPHFQDKQIWFYVAKYAETLAEFYAQQFQYKTSAHFFKLVNEAQKRIYLEPEPQPV
ncbi:helix-turn-helix transcriptional regulator [Bacillus shivajii]|uniref:helix-turn-helix transcriptional regulator n=1 Tax=Bacillus shivajii TaxID=1983719 RepID=UPI001CFC3315|nr:helix-turn-helix transcriptional regulator [Bacillus shivajii]UCZ54268.1 helix-turn-helix transcriptional regulator [Bacillus shivajii]